MQVNRGIISDDDLKIINGSVSVVPIPNTTLEVEFSLRYHAKYPGM